MALGRQQLVIDVGEFAKGMSSGSEVADGGFGDDTEGVNPLIDAGMLYALPALVDSDTDTRLLDNGEIIASAPDHNVFAGDQRLLVAVNTSGDGTFHRYNGTKIPAATYATDITNNYGKGFTDIINYGGETYVTSKELIKRWTSTGTIADLTGGGFTNTTYPHPAIVFENNAYYGDGKLLLRQTAANAAPATILTLSADQVIIALGIDPGSGMMLISTVNSLNISNTLPAICKALWYDGFSNKVSKSVIVDGAVETFHPHGGTIFVCYDGNKIGYLTGSGITFLRKLANASNTDIDQMATKHSFASIGNILCIVDGKFILAYGDILPGRKGFWYIGQNTQNTNKLKCIFNAGANKIGLSFATEKFFTLDISGSTSSTNIDFRSNLYHFPRPIYPRSMYIEFGSAVNTANWVLGYFDEDGSGEKSLSIQNSSTSTYIIPDIIGFQGKVRSLKIRATATTGSVKAIKKIIVYYDWAE